MILITSAAYIDSSLASEFGNIPPCMLPVQNKRLYEHQVKLLREYFPKERICISLPYDYEIKNIDKNRFAELDIQIIPINTNISLGESILHALCCNELRNDNKTCYILHGDTLFSELITELNIASISDNCNVHYNWDKHNNKEVYTGFFSFSNINLLIRSLITYNYDFKKVIKKLDTVKLDGWLDFSLTSTYYKSVSKFTTQRVFNSLFITDYSVTKRSEDKNKMQAEANWLTSLPTELKHYCPAVYDKFDDGYTLEYKYNSSLASIFTFGELRTETLINIIDKCSEYIENEREFIPENPLNTNCLYTEKTLERLAKTDIDLDKQYSVNGSKCYTVKQIIEDLDNYIDKDYKKYASIMHGDFCFSNILWDNVSKSIKLIDPRGRDTNGNISINGDWRYDVAKLAHSLVGDYDAIIAGNFTCKFDNFGMIHFKVYSNIPKEVVDHFDSKFNYKMYYPIMINLFLSMIPLHSDNKERQQAMLANAIRLYNEFKKYEIFQPNYMWVNPTKCR